MAGLSILPIPQLKDNYAYLIHDSSKNVTAVVDPSEPTPILEELKKQGWKLDFILNTHHHADHVGGNLALKGTTHAKVVGNAGDKERIPGIDMPLDPGSELLVGDHPCQLVLANGHTQGHVLYWFSEDRYLFTGDTLFLMGCGRLFEGDARTMWESLLFIRSLPPDTQIYCGHEYSLSNARFALTVDPSNTSLKTRLEHLEQLSKKGAPSVPGTVKEELLTNPFLRTNDPGIKKQLGLVDANEVEVFAELRKRKDSF